MMLGATPRFALLRWIVAGIALGLALMSKYQAALFCVSALLVLSCTKLGRHQLRTPGPWAAGAFASLGLVPVILWNLQHDWTSFAFQSSRAIGPGDYLIYPTDSRRHAARPGSLSLAASMAGRHGLFMAGQSAWREGTGSVFPLLSVVPIAFFDLVALFSPHSLPHWSISGFLFAFPLVGDWCSQTFERPSQMADGLIPCRRCCDPASGNELCRAGKESRVHQAVLRTRTEIRCELAAHRLVCTERHARDPGDY